MHSVYIGTRAAMMAEVAAFDPTTIGIPAKECAFLVKPVGDAEWDTSWHATRKAAMAEARDIAVKYGVKTCTAD